MYRFFIFVSVNILIILCFALAFDVQALEFSKDIQAEDLEIKTPWLLPDSPFYFLKEIKRALIPVFSLNQDPVYQAELKLKLVSERLIEVKMLSEKEKTSEKALNSAIESYQKELTQFKQRIESLGTKIQSERKEAERNEFLEEIVDPFIKHALILEAIDKKIDSPKVKEAFVENTDVFNLLLEEQPSNIKIRSRIGEFYGEFSEKGLVKKSEDIESSLEILSTNVARSVKKEKAIVQKQPASAIAPAEEVRETAETCPMVYRPVCGADGKTYTNRCETTAKEVKISYRGECKKEDEKKIAAEAPSQAVEITAIIEAPLPSPPPPPPPPPKTQEEAVQKLEAVTQKLEEKLKSLDVLLSL